MRSLRSTQYVNAHNPADTSAKTKRDRVNISQNRYLTAIKLSSGSDKIIDVD